MLDLVPRGPLRKMGSRAHLRTRFPAAFVCGGLLVVFDRSSMSRSTRRVRSCEKVLVEKLRLFFEKERAQRQRLSLNRVEERLSLATGFSRKTLYTIHKEFKKSGNKINPSPSKRTRYSKSRLVVNLDDFDLALIRRTVSQFYESHEYPTLDKILTKLKSDGNFPYGRSTLHKVLRKLKFRYAKRDDKVFFYERQDIIESRHKYLREIRKYRKEGRPIVFLDETWANAHMAPERVWLDSEGKGGWKRPSGKGQRLIILHAGNLQLMKSCCHHYCSF